MKKFTTEQLGNLGEIELRQMATREHLVANPVERDVRGYDFVVEFEDEKRGPAFDLDPPTRRVFVQVKASQKQVPSAPIKLSNLQKMALDPNPWFVLLVQVDARGKITKRYLRHVDAELQERTLRALRGATGDLHKTSLKLSARKPDQVEPGDLRSKFEDAIEDWNGYAKSKSLFTKSVGYENDPYLAKVTFKNKPNDGHVKEWVDAALGLPVKLEAERITIIDNRFSVPFQLSDDGPGIIEMHPPGLSGNVRITPLNGDAREAVVLATRIFSTGINPNIPKSYARARFSCGPLNLLVDLQPRTEDDQSVTLRMSTTWDYDVVTSLESISRAASALLLLGTRPTTFSYSIDDTTEKRRDVGHLSQVVLPVDKLTELRVLASCKEVQRHIDLSATQLSSGAIVDDMLAWAILACLLTGDVREVSMSIKLNHPPTEILETHAALIICPRICIGNRDITVVGALVGPSCSPTSIGRFDLIPESTRVLEIYPRKVARSQLVEDVKRFASALEADGFFTVRPDTLLE